MSWLLTHTLSQQEYRMRDRLIFASMGVYVPSRRVIVYPRHTRKPRLVRYPLFARYLFVWVEDIMLDLPVIRSVSANIWTVRTKERQFVYVSDKDISSLVAREVGGEFDQLGESEEIRFVIGDTVLITEGPFADHRGVIHQFIRPKNKCRIELSNCSLEIGIDLLEFAG
jgi:transcription antitermination factor NusG